MSGVERIDLQQHMDRLTRLSNKLGRVTTEWELVEGDAHASPRTPTVIRENGEPLITLGYTRRDALSSLTSMNTILAVVLGV